MPIVIDRFFDMDKFYFKPSKVPPQHRILFPFLPFAGEQGSLLCLLNRPPSQKNGGERLANILVALQWSSVSISFHWRWPSHPVYGTLLRSRRGLDHTALCGWPASHTHGRMGCATCKWSIPVHLELETFRVWNLEKGPLTSLEHLASY